MLTAKYKNPIWASINIDTGRVILVLPVDDLNKLPDTYCNLSNNSVYDVGFYDKGIKRGDTFKIFEMYIFKMYDYLDIGESQYVKTLCRFDLSNERTFQFNNENSRKPIQLLIDYAKEINN